MRTVQAAGLVGLGCADYAKANPSGAGSVDGMAAAPVATAASGNSLKTDSALLTYPVVAGEHDPAAVVGKQTTVEKLSVTVTAPAG